jgi:hypothetical protein
MADFKRLKQPEGVLPKYPSPLQNADADSFWVGVGFFCSGFDSFHPAADSFGLDAHAFHVGGDSFCPEAGVKQVAPGLRRVPGDSFFPGLHSLRTGRGVRRIGREQISLAVGIKTIGGMKNFRARFCRA